MTKPKTKTAMNIDITEVFCFIDDFCQFFEPIWKKKLLSDGKIRRNRKGFMSLSEIMTILVLFHQSKMRTFKDFYLRILKVYWKPYFPKLLSYNRFVEWIPRTIVPFISLFTLTKGECSGISFIDSMPIKVCHKIRAKRNKVFKDIAHSGKSSMGWFFGFKLHAVINHVGEIIDVVFTSGNIHDSNMTIKLSKNLFGYLFGDKGYISKEKTDYLRFCKGIKLVTNVRANMKAIPKTSFEKMMLSKRFLIETVFGKLQSSTNINHSRHRSPRNFLANLFSSLVSYNKWGKKPKISTIEMISR